MKKILSVTLAATLLFASAAVYAADQQTYNDLKTTNWAYESVKAMSDKDIIKGYPDGSFKPQSTVTYGEFIKMMVVAVTGEELTVAEKPHHWAYNYYQKALELNLFAEAEIDTTMLNNAIPRSDMALIISNGLGKTEVENYSDIEETVSDVDSTTKYDYHIIKSYATGILSGYSDGTFKPKGTLTRAESSVVLYRYTDESKRTPIKINEEKTVNGVEISIENSYNKDLKWVQCGDLSEVLSQNAIEQLRKIAMNGNLNAYVMVKDYEAFGLEFESKNGGSWFKMKERMAYDKYGLPHVIEGKELSKYEKSSRSYQDGTLYVNLTDQNAAKKIDYIALVPGSSIGGNVVTLIVNPYK